MRHELANRSRREFLKQLLSATAISCIGCHGAVAAGIDGLPDIGDSDRTNLSPFQADLLGREVILDIYSRGSMVDDYDSLDYINSLGSNLVSYSPLAGQPFNFYLIKDKNINAFALPGGHICVYNGLIYATLSEAEFSSVMAHEIGHIVQHHIFRNISAANRGQWTAIAGLVAGALLATVNPAAGLVAAQGGQGLAQQNALANSRDYEREADRVGQQLLYSAGFDAHAMPEFFQRMEDAYKFDANDALAFLQTHPVTVERLSEAEARANQLPVKMRQDSLDFLLVREKCRIRQISSEDALKFYVTAIANRRYVNLDAQYYGLALSYFMTKQLSLSCATLAKITPQVAGHPIVLGLRARQFIALKEFKLAAKIYAASLVNYPNHKGLWMGQLEFLIAVKSYGEAAQRLDNLAQTNPQDPDVWDQYAILYADSRYNNPLRYHYGLGNEFYYLGNYQLALDHYQLALSIKTTADNDLQDSISAKLVDARYKLHF